MLISDWSSDVCSSDLTKNNFLIPNLNKIICYFPLKNLEDLDDVRVYNYFYFFKFFFGFRAFFIGYKSIQSFSKVTYDFKVQIILRKDEIFSLLSFFVYDILPILDADYYSMNLIKGNLISYHFLIKDMSIFSEKKTNRSEELRLGKECVSKYRYRWS